MPHSRWGTEELFERLSPLLPGLSIEVLARTDSTNTQLLERARLHAPRSGAGDAVYGRRAGDTQPCLLVAEHQTGGRGRLGRVWKSAPDASLTFSLALPLHAADWSGLSLAVGVAIADALDPPPAPHRLKLKWPNDLWLADTAAEHGGRKLGGVLIESLAVGERRMAVVGIGLNVNKSEGLGAAIACVEEFDASATAPSVLARIAPALAHALIEFDRAGFAPHVAAFHSRDLLLGQRVHVLPGGPQGVADGVASDGSLRIVDDFGALQLVVSGEVSVRFAGAGDAGPTTQ